VGVALVLLPVAMNVGTVHNHVFKLAANYGHTLSSISYALSETQHQTLALYCTVYPAAAYFPGWHTKPINQKIPAAVSTPIKGHNQATPKKTACLYRNNHGPQCVRPLWSI